MAESSLASDRRRGDRRSALGVSARRVCLSDIVDPDGPPPWLHLPSPIQQAWREKRIMKGRDPDPYIVNQLMEAGRWPEKKAK